jgi:RES domain-containing protein
MRSFRICSSRHPPLDGEGARLAGGRWNPPGIPVIYMSASSSLAVLELLVHTDSDLLPTDLSIVELQIPDTIRIEIVDPATLPADWREYPAPESLQAIGARWSRARRAPVLAVPSAVNPMELNYLVNPDHPDASRATLVTARPFVFDPRLFK